MTWNERDLTTWTAEELRAEIHRLRDLLRRARSPVRQWCAEYSMATTTDDALLEAIEALPDDS
jgi:peptidoglycan/xylan/chitin deacetylase (PgdA/CDA1 family)